MFGTIKHAPIHSPELDRRVRVKYQNDIEQLNRLGFDYLCSDGESFPLFRLLFVFPVVILAIMFFDGMPMTITGGTILTAWPVLVARNRFAFATSPDGSHVKFLTAFRDGTLLVSLNYDGPASRGPGIIRQCAANTISDAWAKHQARIQALEAEGKQVDRRATFEDYVEMADRDTAVW
jgi:hypothetical protein